jgi:flagellar biosynthetic protein FlhB
MEELLRVSGMHPIRAVPLIWGVAFTLLVRVTMAVCALGLLDYVYQRWEHERGLRMTKEEVKEEYRQTEGDPLVRARIRSLQKQVAMRRMMAAVPKADVVLTNPTHLAVAIRYDEQTMRAPKVVAKGPRLIAERIVTLAKQNGVPIVENKPLARSLYKLVAVGQEIPAALYRAVAEILAYDYALAGRRRR